MKLYKIKAIAGQLPQYVLGSKTQEEFEKQVLDRIIVQYEGSNPYGYDTILATPVLRTMELQRIKNYIVEETTLEDNKWVIPHIAKRFRETIK